VYHGRPLGPGSIPSARTLSARREAERRLRADLDAVLDGIARRPRIDTVLVPARAFRTQLRDRRIAAIHDHLGTLPERGPRAEIGAECCAVIDLGAGPRTVLISSVDVGDEDVVSTDSPLGRA
jgi:hypothetical protein